MAKRRRSQIPPQRPASPEEKMDGLQMMLGEHFDDYIVITRLKSHPETGRPALAWRSSDNPWALGVMGTVSNFMTEAQMRRFFAPPEEPK